MQYRTEISPKIEKDLSLSQGSIAEAINEYLQAQQKRVEAGLI